MKKLSLVMAILILAASLTGCSRVLELFECKHREITPATCTTGEICAKCGEVLGEPNNHMWEDATCTEPKTCSVCGKTEGQPSAHKWETATCIKPKTCSACGKTDGDVVAHIYQDGSCKWCYSSDPYYLDILNNSIFTINQINWDINSVGGVEVDISFTNKSNKQIAYVYFNVKCYDRMGNPAYCEIKNIHTRRLQFTGPINPGRSDTGYWDPIIYCDTTAAIEPLTVEIEYTDGTRVTITNNGRYWFTVDYYGGALKD